jgi:RNA polymerase sigma factor (sigma-70 family)
MPSGRLQQVIHSVGAALRPRDAADVPDRELLERFRAGRDEAAFAALVRRHGRMVLGVCRRVVGHAQDAEDAFQATFLVLARRPGAVAPRAAVGGWLYGVAYRTALAARARSARRAAREKQVMDMPHPEVVPDDSCRELVPLLDSELARLPDKYRLPVVLCELEGRPRKEVARQLGLPEGTLSSRLAAARKLLARRLAPYGPAVSVAALGTVLAEGAAAAVPAALVASTIRAAAGAVPAEVAALTQGVIKAMFVAKLKGIAWVTMLTLAVSAGGIGLTYRTAAAAPQEPARAAVRDDLEALRLEIEALRKSLQATRSRLQALEGEIAALKGTGESKPAVKRSELKLDVQPEHTLKYTQKLSGQPVQVHVRPENVRALDVGTVTFTLAQPKRADVLRQAAEALEKLKKDPENPKVGQEAAEALERAAKRLRALAKPDIESVKPAKR